MNVPRPRWTLKIEEQACDFMVVFFFFYSRLIDRGKKLACLTALRNISTLKKVYKNPLKLSLTQQFILNAK